MTFDDIDYLDYARMVKPLRGMKCAICGMQWVCPKDAYDRKPLLLPEGGAACAKCYLPPGDDTIKEVSFCLAHSEELSRSEEALLTRVASLTSIDMDDWRRVNKIAARIRGDE